MSMEDLILLKNDFLEDRLSHQFLLEDHITELFTFWNSLQWEKARYRQDSSSYEGQGLSSFLIQSDSILESQHIAAVL